ncbi:MAG: hypothetical protein ABI622_02540, partial [Chloroflexota bacterium]
MAIQRLSVEKLVLRGTSIESQHWPMALSAEGKYRPNRTWLRWRDEVERETGIEPATCSLEGCRS